MVQDVTHHLGCRGVNTVDPQQLGQGIDMFALSLAHNGISLLRWGQRETVINDVFQTPWRSLDSALRRVTTGNG